MEQQTTEETVDEEKASAGDAANTEEGGKGSEGETELERLRRRVEQLERANKTLLQRCELLESQGRDATATPTRCRRRHSGTILIRQAELLGRSRPGSGAPSRP